jgi:hypothetical protein
MSDENAMGQVIQIDEARKCERFGTLSIPVVRLDGSIAVPPSKP